MKTSALKRQPFQKVLRELGFVRDFADKTYGVYQYVTKGFCAPHRIVRVQLWDDGNHRASHMFKDCCRRVPTNFTTVEGMKKAIVREATCKP